MDNKQRIVTQRIMMRQVEGVLNSVSELFGAEDDPHNDNVDQASEEYRIWRHKTEEFMKWVWEESPLA
jgi:hypothetical protein